METSKWDATAGIIVKEKLKGKPCYVGVDLSKVSDITAVVQVFPSEDKKYRVIPHFYLPGDDIIEREKKDRVPYRVWVKQGFITLTPGNVIDYDFIEHDMDEICRSYRVLEVGYDRYRSDLLIQHLMQKGLTCVPIGQGFVSLTTPTEFLETLILQKRIVHSGNPVLRWMISNAVATYDPAGNVKLDKAKSNQKIDGLAALINALARAVVYENKPIPYRDRGLMVI
jgi:phage terminase large subunit-like protein